MATAVLSITAKQKKKLGKKDGEEKMDVDTEKKEDKKEKMEVEEEKAKEGEKKDEEKKKEPEPLFDLLANPARVMKAQLKVVTLEDGEDNKYLPNI